MSPRPSRAEAEVCSRHSALEQQLRGIAAESQAKRRGSGDGAEPAAKAAKHDGEQAAAGIMRPPLPCAAGGAWGLAAAR